MDYQEISDSFNKKDVIKSLKDGTELKYSGHLTLISESIGYDSFNDDLIVYKEGQLADVVEHGVDEQLLHIQKVRDLCSLLNCTPNELLNMDYMLELTK